MHDWGLRRKELKKGKLNKNSLMSAVFDDYFYQLSEMGNSGKCEKENVIILEVKFYSCYLINLIGNRSATVLNY